MVRLSLVHETDLYTTDSSAAGTAYITFDNVKVPVENLLGKEGKGIYVILSNFNVSLRTRKVFDPSYLVLLTRSSWRATAREMGHLRSHCPVPTLHC